MSVPSTLTSGYPALAEAARARPPQVAIVLGSGMGDVARRLRPCAAAGFTEVPGLSAPSVAGHRGHLILGEWANRRVLVCQGRLHYYEGHPWRSVLETIHLANFLGARILLLTNAAGGIHDALGPGNLMVIRNHLDWTGCWCWNHSGTGFSLPRPSPYSPRLEQILVHAAGDLGMELHQGIYASVLGPSFETPAEIRALKNCGADAVGMSTAREIQAAQALGMECAAISCITNRAAGLLPGTINHNEVLTTARDQIPRLAELVERFVALS